MSRKTRPPFAKPSSDRFYWVVHAVIRLLVRVLARPEVAGLEYLPPTGAYLLAGNHLSAFDAPVAFAAIPQRLVALGADTWRAVPVLAWVLERLGIIWVARGEADVDAIKAALGVLKAGGRLGVAPEGTRSRTTNALEPGKPGVAYLADRAGVPVVPMVITGTENVVRAWKRLRRPRVSVTLGQPIVFPRGGRAKGAQLDAHTDVIMCRLAAMLPPQYRGVYADRIADQPAGLKIHTPDLAEDG